MSEIKKLNVTVSYSVEYGDIDNVPQIVLKQLQDAYYNGHSITTFDAHQAYPDALDWLSDQVSERDCFEWQCEIFDLE